MSTYFLKFIHLFVEPFSLTISSLDIIRKLNDTNTRYRSGQYTISTIIKKVQKFERIVFHTYLPVISIYATYSLLAHNASMLLVVGMLNRRTLLLISVLVLVSLYIILEMPIIVPIKRITKYCVILPFLVGSE